jgi:hypothetical protein
MKKFGRYIAVAVSTALAFTMTGTYLNYSLVYAQNADEVVYMDAEASELDDLAAEDGVISESEAEDTEIEDVEIPAAESEASEPADVSAPDDSMTVYATPKASEYTQVEQFCIRLYQTCLGRDFDKSGLAYWNNALVNRELSGARVAYSFVFSKEYQDKNVSNDEYVEMLYKTFMNRASDKAGKAYWVDYLNQGLSREYVFQGFCQSQEFDGICNSYGITRGSIQLTQYRDKNAELTKYVNRLYVEVMGRSGDASGLNYWCKKILDKENTPIEVAQTFFGTKEFKDKQLGDTEFVQLLYRAFMNREAETSGLNGWVDKLESGMSRSSVISFFETSTEFKTLLISYGLSTEVHYYPWTHKDGLTGLMGTLEDAPVNIKTSGNATLDAQIQSMLSKCTNSSMSRSEQLAAAYDYMVATYKYQYNYNYNCAAYGNNKTVAWASVLFRDGYGSCNNWNSAFTYVARALGYDAHLYYGSTSSTSGSWTEHYWTAIKINGTDYTFDPLVEENITRRSGRNGHARFGLSGSAAAAKFRYSSTII